MENTEVKKPKKTKYILSILFMLILIVVTIIYLVNQYNFNDVMSALGEVNIFWILLAIPLVFIYILFEGLAMKVILHALGFNVSVKDNFVYSAVDYFFCAVTPSATGGQPMVLYYMAKDRLPVAESSLVLLINTAMFKIILMSLSVVSVIVCPQYVFNSVLVTILFFVGFAINLFLVIMCFLGAFKRKWIEAAGKRIIMILYRFHIVKDPLKTMRTFREKMNDYEKGAKLIKYHKKHFLLALTANLIQRVSLFAIGYLVFIAFSRAYPEIDNFNFMHLLAVQVIIALSVDSLPLPGGIGISEVLYQSIFGIIYVVGTLDLVGPALLLTRAAAFYIPVIVTMIIWLIRHIRVTFIHKRRSQYDRIL